MTGEVSAPGRSTVVLAAMAVLILAAASTVGLIWFTSGSGTTVTSGCSPSHPAGARLDVELADMGMGGMMAATPMRATLRLSTDQVASGTVTIVAHNSGRLVHELVVLPLPSDGAGTRPIGADDTVDETGSLGEASKSCAAGSGDGITPGSAGWVTLHVHPGRYELVCNESGHYRVGMFSALTVS